jgi:PncC family amidohydrolase
MDEPVEVVAGDLARQLNIHLAVAESCTGGLISHLLTNVPGSSDYFLGSVVSYANQVKIQLVGVKPETLAIYGAVSRETVLEMARGVRQVLSADIGISVSGIAGPGGNTPDKPVGTTWIGLSAAELDQAWLFQFSGDRQGIKRQAAEMALRLLVDQLKPGVLRRTVPGNDS